VYPFFRENKVECKKETLCHPSIKVSTRTLYQVVCASCVFLSPLCGIMTVIQHTKFIQKEKLKNFKVVRAESSLEVLGIRIRNTDPSRDLKSETQIRAVIYIRNTDPSCHLYPEHRSHLSSISEILIPIVICIRKKNTDKAVICTRNTDPSCHLYKKH
jgi:hypothetical protein